MIAFRQHLEKNGSSYADWDSGSCSDAPQMLNSITSFDFVVVSVTMYQYLSHLARMTVKLLRQASDMMISEVCQWIQVAKDRCRQQLEPYLSSEC